MDNINYVELAEALLKDDLFIGKISAKVAQVIQSNNEDIKKIAGRLKNEAQNELAELKKVRVQELKDDMNTWFNDHMRKQILDRRDDIMRRLEDHVETFFRNDPIGVFRSTAENIIVDLIRQKFSKQTFSFSIEDLIVGDRSRRDPDF